MKNFFGKKKTQRGTTQLRDKNKILKSQPPKFYVQSSSRNGGARCSCRLRVEDIGIEALSLLAGKAIDESEYACYRE